MAVPAKKRKMNFSEREVEIIVEELELKKHLLVNHFNAGVPLAAKSAAWHSILRRVNAVATCRRELPEVKKKWSDLKTEVRRKVAQSPRRPPTTRWRRGWWSTAPRRRPRPCPPRPRWR